MGFVYERNEQSASTVGVTGLCINPAKGRMILGLGDLRGLPIVRFNRFQRNTGSSVATLFLGDEKQA